LDPLDPLTEIVKTGQAFSPFILLERLVWLFIGLFFLGAFIKGIRTDVSDQKGQNHKLFSLKFNKKDDKNNNSISGDNEKRISKN